MRLSSKEQKNLQKNKPYKGFSRFRTDLSLVGLTCALYVLFLIMIMLHSKEVISLFTQFSSFCLAHSTDALSSSLHKPSKENSIVTLRQVFQFLHKGIRIAGAACNDQFFICLDILECLNQISNALFWHQTTEEQYVGILFQSKIISDQLRFPNLWSIYTIRDKMRLSPISFLKIVLHSFAQNNDLVRIFRSIFFALVDSFSLIFYLLLILWVKTELHQSLPLITSGFQLLRSLSANKYFC